jgi:hypothetical protein
MNSTCKQTLILDFYDNNMNIPDLTPTKRILSSGKIVTFFSPHQLEYLVPVEKRLSKQRYTFTEQGFNVGFKRQPKRL